MKTRILTVFILITAFLFTSPVIAQEKLERKIEEKVKRVEEKLKEKELHLGSIDIPEMHLDLSGLEQSMQQLEVSLQQLEHIEIPEINVDIPEIYVPEIYVPDIYVPDIYIPEFDFDFDEGFIFYEEGDWDHSNLFDDLSEDEQLKITALRAISRQNGEKAIPAIEKVIKEESHPALRYEAVRHLRRFLDDKRVVPILGKVARDDKNIDVRKKAIYLLGKSGDKRAVKILEELAER